MQLFIDGKFVNPVEGGTLPVVNPATGEKLCDAPAASAKDVDLAVRAATRAFEAGPWPKLSPTARGRALRKFADLVFQHREDLALLESLNNGKTFKDALRTDVGPAATTLSYYSEWANKILGEVLPVGGPFHTYVLKEPVGVVGAIVPWNFPLSLTSWKLGPALATGCTVVLKPSELTPLTALKLGELAQAAGLPDGVLNIVPGFGDPAGDALARHPDVAKVSFTGSARTARRLLLASSETNLKKLSLELGGKSPQVIFADADFDAAVEACFWGIFGNKGEVCAAGSRVLVHEKAYDAFVERLVERAKKLVVGDPLDPKTEMGAQVSERQLQSVLKYIASGREQGARVLAGGDRDSTGAKAKGAFVQPTIFGDVKPEMKIAQEEIFGPVLSCLRFKDDAEALAIANGTSYGLAASLWTRDTAKAQALAKKVKSGVVWINCFNQFDDAAPFGGYKESGWGRDLSHHALDGYLQSKTVWTRLPDQG
jgi:acyl-CoA reductase-like NAD-dependent aldehyde dehydrogenase